ncbi:MAG: hypothetical protein BWY99_02929 [Synergistetes bacterium ADurb.BinA166]|nr:MAG: hypothetical protein BWY99_02929 [Synergistetes bacterium ADurb.BinA166]
MIVGAIGAFETIAFAEEDAAPLHPEPFARQLHASTAHGVEIREAHQFLSHDHDRLKPLNQPGLALFGRSQGFVGPDAIRDVPGDAHQADGLSLVAIERDLGGGTPAGFSSGIPDQLGLIEQRLAGLHRPLFVLEEPGGIL